MDKKSIDSKVIEALAFFASAKSFNEYDVMYLKKRGILGEALSLTDLQFVNRRIEKREYEDDEALYSITDKGKEYFDKLLQYAKDIL